GAVQRLGHARQRAAQPEEAHPARRPWHGGTARRPEGTRPAAKDVGDLDGGIWTDAAHQPDGRPRPLSACLQRRPRWPRRPGAAAGFAAGVPLAWFGSRWWRDSGQDLWNQLAGSRFSGRSRENERPELAMPGRYPGRVVQVHDPAAVRPHHSADPAIVRKMID